MARCGSCGTELPDGAKFCYNCGQSVAAPTCASCGADLVPEAQFCMHCGAAVEPAASASETPGKVSSRRVTSILFGDLVGFTTLSEARDQEDVRELLGRYFDEASRIVARYGGQVEKYIGDAVMAVWGVPTSREDDAERAVRAGLELASMVRDVGIEIGVPDMAMRVGIVTGEVAVTEGATGQGMVAGDPVNTAARVQTAASPGQVWVDETTRILTSAAIAYADAGTHELKGKADPMPLWSARAVVAAVGGAQRADGLEAPLVGRDRELRLVKELFHRSEETSKPVLLVVEGEPGVGKSRLGWEFEKYVDGLETTVRWHSGRCVAYGEGVAYFALAEAFRGRLLASADPGEDADDAALLERVLDTYLTDDEERAWLRPRIGALLGIGSVGSFAREDLYSAWTAFLGSVGAGGPVALLIDDAHHADDGLLMFVEHLLDNAQFPCFVVMLSRPGLLAAHPSLITRAQTNVVHLSALTSADMAQMLDGLVDGLPQQSREGLVTRAEGLPLFAVETVRSLIDRDLVIPRGGRYVLADDAPVDVERLDPPASLHALLAARLDALTAEQRLVVERASVLGTSFPADTLRAICPEASELDSILTALVRLQILARETSRLSAEFGDYRFVHSTVRQVAYGTLSRRDRKAIHLQVVAKLEDQDAGDELAAIRAQHYLEALEAIPQADDVAGLRAAAVENLRRAAKRARELGSPTESARHLAAAVDLADDDGDRARLLSRQAQAELESGNYEATVEHAAAAEDALVALGDRVGAGLAASLRGEALIQGRGDLRGAVKLLQPWWEELRGREDANETLLQLTLALSHVGDSVEIDSQDILEERLRLAERSESVGELARGFTMLAVYNSRRGLIPLTLVLLDAAADLARTDHNLPTLASARFNLTAIQATRDLPAAIRAGTESVETARRTGIPWLLDLCASNLELAQWNAGDWAGLAEPLEKADQASHALRLSMRVLHAMATGAEWQLTGVEYELSDDLVVNSWVVFMRAVSALITRDVPAATAQGMEAVEIVYGVGGVWDDLVHMWPTVFEVAIRQDDREAVTRLLVMCQEHRAQLPRGMRAHWAYAQALLAISEDRDEEIESLLGEAIEHFEAWGAVPSGARAKGLLGRWLREHGRLEEGDRLVAESRHTLMELGAQAWLAELDEPVQALIPVAD